ncbi:ribonuclease P [Ignicoccus pacificus DSM 13166]|uniref:Ribonuclease P protein component 1 n=1 Tax=Ignicoccus pacificus DSM 13166 TaxID=940294 RepID=A0A977K8Z5_9CREN|nr:ribonuclease P [Ignicoccus pacificus DSM 13166]
MKRTPQNLPYHDLIGLRVEIIEHPTESLKGLKGRIVGETRHTLKIEGDDKKERIVLKQGYFKFLLPNGEEVVLEGWRIQGRPEERLKRFLKRR